MKADLTATRIYHYINEYGYKTMGLKNYKVLIYFGNSCRVHYFKTIIEMRDFITAKWEDELEAFIYNEETCEWDIV